MGVIRGGHTSPGTYTKFTTIERKTYKKQKPMNTANVYIEAGGKKILMYFGYTGIVTDRGKITEEVLNKLSAFTEKEINASNSILPYNVEVGEDGVILEQSIKKQSIKTDNDLTEEQLRDQCNNCVVVVIDKETYDKNNFKIIDTTLGIPIGGNLTEEEEENDLFYEVANDITIRGEKYVMLAMFNTNYAYCPLYSDKKIAPLQIKIEE